MHDYACCFCGKDARENPPREPFGAGVLGSNLKIYSTPPGYKTGGRGGVSMSKTTLRHHAHSSVDLPAGPPAFGGACPTTTPACEWCYAQLGEDISGELTELNLNRLQFLRDDPDGYGDAIVKEVKEAKPPLVRIHSFGDFVDEMHVRVWISVVRRLPHVPFFGTTRTWQLGFNPSARAASYMLALAEFRMEPNVSFGGSVEGGVLDPATGKVRDKSPNHRSRVIQSGPWKGATIIDWLHGQDPPFNVWNMLSEFTDPELRRRYGAGATFRYGGGASERQFEVARELGFLVGEPCPEQTKKVRDCAHCRTPSSPDRPHCLNKSDGTGRYDVSFSYHSGRSKRRGVKEAEK